LIGEGVSLIRGQPIIPNAADGMAAKKRKRHKSKGFNQSQNRISLRFTNGVKALPANKAAKP
jgi:hypothetical protein